MQLIFFRFVNCIFVAVNNNLSSVFTHRCHCGLMKNDKEMLRQCFLKAENTLKMKKNS